MNQIPNIEETHNTREVEEMVEHFNNQFTDHDDGTFTVGLDIRYATKKDFTEFIRANLHHQLQKAREGCLCKDKGVIELIEENKKDWLREEIVKLEGMKTGAELRSGDYSEHRGIGFDKALQTIIDRYHSELDQDSSNTN